MGAYSTNFIDEEEVAKESGFRNFTSFISIYYYGEKCSLKECGKVLGVSATKIKSSISKRGFPLRNRGLRPGVAPSKKRSIDINGRIRQTTPYFFSWCALYNYYDRFQLTTYEISDIVGISQPVILRLLRKYKIPIRRPGFNSLCNLEKARKALELKRKKEKAKEKRRIARKEKWLMAKENLVNVEDRKDNYKDA